MASNHTPAAKSGRSSVSYGARVSAMAHDQPDRTALTFVDAAGIEFPISWHELDVRSNRIARALVDRGVGPRGLVIIELPNSIEHIVSTLGVWKAGGCVLPLRWDLPDWERERVIDVAAPTAVISRSRKPGRWLIANPSELESATISDAPVEDRTPDPARAIASSGSTGTPKIICANGSGTFDLSAIENGVINTLGQDNHAVQLVPAPLYHTNGSLLTFTSLLQGQSLVLMERFSATLALDLIERHRVTTLTATTIMLQRMSRTPDIADRNLSSIESLLHGGAPLPQWLGRFWVDRIGPERFFVAYGSSENAGVCFARGDEWLTHPGTVGRPVGTEIRIRDEAGHDLPAGETGLVHLRRPDAEGPVFRYLGGQPSTDADGFTALGDLGWLDDDGYLYLADRRVDMIITGGANVYPAEVEGALTEHAGVADAVVVGLADDEWGERVHAVIEPMDAAAPPSVDELRRFCRSRLAAYKVPKTVEIVDRLPRSDAGKIRRADMARDRSPHDGSQR